jgi:thiamine-phosphate pyrophosphorylase
MFDPAVLRLVAVTDSLRDGIDGLAGRAAAVVRGGATMVHLRLQNESPRTLVAVARALRLAVPGVPLLVNDRTDVALAADADGVHVGTDGLSPAALRRVVPARFVIGASLGMDDDVARVAGADYVGVGPVFGAGGATDALGVAGVTELCARCGLPVVAIGGITPENAARVRAAGACGVAAISALFGASDPSRAARALRSAQDASER